MDAIVLAEVSLEVADYLIDVGNDYPRAEWRWNTIEKAIEIVKAENITRASEDIDEIVLNYLVKQREVEHGQVSSISK
jgi:hypothetical protein